MKKGFKFVETIKAESDGEKCLTPCPHNIQNICGILKVGSYSCSLCEHHSSREANSVNCLYKYNNKDK